MNSRPRGVSVISNTKIIMNNQKKNMKIQQLAPVGQSASVPKPKKVKKKQSSSSPYSSPVQDWVSMVLTPYSASVVKSPASSSILCSKTRIIESRDISYADTLGGYFSVIVRPSLVYPLMIAKSPERFPAVGSTEILGSTISLIYSNLSSDPGSRSLVRWPIRMEIQAS